MPRGSPCAGDRLRAAAAITIPSKRRRSAASSRSSRAPSRDGRPCPGRARRRGRPPPARVHVLLDQQHADPLALQPHDRAHHVLHDLRRQALARLVEQHQARGAEQRARDRHHLHLAAGEVLALALQQILERAEDLEALGERPGAEARALAARSSRLRATVSARNDAPVVGHPADAARGRSRASSRA